VRAPARGSEDWNRLAQLDGFYANYMEAAEKELLRYVAPPAVATKVMSTIKLLSAHAEDEKYLSAGGERMEWLPLSHDPGLKDIFDKFCHRMRIIDDIIDQRNAESERLARSPDAGGLPYTLLRPTSESPGVSFRGVPYSISI
jgi:lipoxygenase